MGPRTSKLKHMYSSPEPEDIVNKIFESPYLAHHPRNSQQLEAITERLQHRLGTHGLSREDAQKLGRFLEGLDAPARIQMGAEAFNLREHATGDSAVEAMNTLQNERMAWSQVRGAIEIRDMLREVGQEGEVVLDLDQFNDLSPKRQAAVNQITRSVSGLLDRLEQAYSEGGGARSEKAQETLEAGKQELLDLVALMTGIAREEVELDSVAEKIENAEIGLEEYILKIREQSASQGGRSR